MPYDVLAPLVNFHWDGDEFEFAPGVWIRRLTKLPELPQFEDQLSRDEWEKAEEASHWLFFEWDGTQQPEPNEVTELVLLALWLVTPTKTQFRFRFQIEQNSTSNHTRRQRILDRFAWIDGAIADGFVYDDLVRASQLYAALVSIYLNRGRLSNALLLTVTGCWSHFWQSALVCHAAAVEAILTYSTGAGITRRLGISYACVSEVQAPARDAAYREFTELYSIRSDIMHGRPHNVPAPLRLPNLARFQGLLRNLWRIVLQSPRLIDVLEGTDAEREAYFLTLQDGYAPPANQQP